MKRLFQKLRHFYLYDIKLSRKLLISHLLLIILPTIVLTLFLNTKLYDIIVSDTVLTEQTLAVQTTNTVETTISLITQASDSLADSDSVLRLLSYGAKSWEEEEVRGEISKVAQQADSLIDGILITDIQFYLDSSWETILSVSDDSVFSDLNTVTATYWYGIFYTSGEDSLFCPDLYLSVTEAEEKGDLAYIRRLKSTAGSEIYLAIYFSQDELSSILADNVTTDNSATYIINERDTVVSSSSSALSGAYYMSNDDLEELTGGVNMYTTRSYREDSIYVGYYEIEGTQWHLVSILSADSLTRKGNMLVLQFVGIYLLFFLMALCIAILLSRSIAKRIATLSRQMQNVHRQTPVRIEAKTEAHDEIGDLLNTYNYMSDEINELLAQQAQAAEDLKLQEFNALQAQINPHFLYNSLDMINWLNRGGKKEDVSRIVQALSRFYKLSLSRSDSHGTVAMELEHVSLYVQIQNMRYENRITFIVDVPDAMMDYEMPRLILQPIIENSILHGILEKPGEPGMILITGWMEGGDVVLLISDDGIGMTPEQIETVLSGSDKSGTGSHIGIFNTHSRLQLLYGQEYGLSYESTPGQGTDTQVRFPGILPEGKGE